MDRPAAGARRPPKPPSSGLRCATVSLASPAVCRREGAGLLRPPPPADQQLSVLCAQPGRACELRLVRERGPGAERDAGPGAGSGAARSGCGRGTAAGGRGTRAGAGGTAQPLPARSAGPAGGGLPPRFPLFPPPPLPSLPACSALRPSAPRRPHRARLRGSACPASGRCRPLRNATRRGAGGPHPRGALGGGAEGRRGVLGDSSALKVVVAAQAASTKSFFFSFL